MPRRKRKLPEAEQKRRNPVRKSKRSPAEPTAVVPSSSCDVAAKPNDSSSDAESSDWEEVEEGIIGSDESSSNREPVIPKEGVEITLEASDVKSGRRNRKRFDVNEYFQKLRTKIKREVQESMHKVHLLCLLARGLHVNDVIDEDIVRAVALSLIPADLLSDVIGRPKKTLKDVKRVQSWCRSEMDEFVASSPTGIDDCRRFDVGSILQDLERNGDVEGTRTPFRSVVIVALFFRILGFDVRIVFSFRPIPLKPHATKSKKESQDASGGSGKPMATTSKTGTAKRKNRKDRHTSKPGIPDSKLEQKPLPVRRSGRRRKETSVGLKTGSSEDENCNNPEVPHKSAKMASDDEHDEDFEVEVIKINNPGPLRGIRKNRKTLSTDSDDDDDNPRSSGAACSNDCWLEVYVHELKQWVCVDPINEHLNEPHQIEKWITQPIKYIVAFDGNGHVKDVTSRYASGWLSSTRKLRVDPDWWNETLESFRGPSSKRGREEDAQLDKNLKDRPLPTTISEYKNHPFYALKRHLLKFEGIYPPDAVPVGFVRSEPVYARHCIKELHSRETWLKEARLVRIGETPYKVVKARPKWNKAMGEMQSDLMVEVFGEWQTEEYIPPPAKDGKVPRNDYGNVELFKPCMLPSGTVHLQIPGLNRVARKLDIDCAQAMIGWDFHGVGSHPIFDGWVVCEEFKDVLMDAWHEEQIIIDQKEREKREKRIYGNWRRIIRGLLIRERLQSKYGSSAAAAAAAESPERVRVENEKSSSKRQKTK